MKHPSVFASVMVALNLVVWGIAFAIPTPVATKLSWDPPTQAQVTGMFLYWAKEIESPRVYDDTRKIDIGLPASNEAIVLDIKPDAESDLCFRGTFYNASGQESGFSNEACDFFGIEKPVITITPGST